MVKPIVSEALKLLRSSLPANIEIKRNMASNSSILCDPVDVHQLLLNLCSNAALAMEAKGGTLTVELKDMELGVEAAQKTKGLEPGNYVTLTVSDNGTGMEERVRRRIFEPFFTTRPEGEGSGMGLAVVHGIVNSCGGHITVDSSPGAGSVFRVYFPRFEPVLEETGGGGDLPRGAERVLFVDDEDFQLNLAKKSLGALGYKVTVITDPALALEEFRARPGDYDLVITDMTMPQMSGIDLAKEIKSIRTGIPVVLSTGYAQMLSEKPAAKLGVEAVVAKPVPLRTMAETIRNVLERKRA